MKVAIIGMGTMGSAIKKCLKDDYEVIGIDINEDLKLVQRVKVIILAVKPQAFDELSKNLKPLLNDQEIISIMAGVKLEQISQKLGAKNTTRTMPNLGVQNGKSLTAAYMNGAKNKESINHLLKEWGDVIWIKSEQDFDLFTAIAGSGPAYFYELANQLQNIAIENGFDKDLARKIATSTLQSAAAAIDNEDPTDKIQQVASKGGVTQAGLKVLSDNGFDKLIEETVKASEARSKELSNG